MTLSLSLALAQTITPHTLFEFPDDNTSHHALVEDGLIIYNGYEFEKIEVYDWIDGELVGPYPVDMSNREEVVSFAARDGDRIAFGGFLSPIDTYLWSEADQAYLLEATLEDENGQYGGVPLALGGGRMLARDTLYELHAGEWVPVYTLPDPGEAGFGSVWLTENELRMVTRFDEIHTYLRDPATNTWSLHSSFYDPSFIIWESTFNSRGDLTIRTFPAMYAFDLTGDELVYRDRLDPTLGATTFAISSVGSTHWLVTTHIEWLPDFNPGNRSLHVLDTRSPEPFLWGSVRPSTRDHVAHGFLDESHLVSMDHVSLLYDEGQLVIWELSGPPVLQDLGPATVDEGAATALDASAYLMDPDHDLTEVEVSVLVDPEHGALTVDGVALPPGTSFDGAAWFEGRAAYAHDGSETLTDALAVQACDPDGTCSDAVLVELDVLPVNDPPLPLPDTLVVAEGGDGLVEVLANDADVDSVLDMLGVSLTAPEVGTASVRTDGVHYAHDGSEPGPDPVVIDLTVCDVQGGCAPSTVEVTVTPVNDPPDAIDDLISLDEGGTLVVSVLDNDVDPDDELATTGTLTVISGPVHGSVAVVPDGLELTHDGAEVTSDSVAYEVCDAAGACDVAVVAVIVEPVNDAPDAQNDRLVLTEAGSGTLDPVANDVDVDGVLEPSSFAIVQGPAHGTLDLDGTLVTYHHEGTTGAEDAFTYTICDDVGGCSEAHVEVVIHDVDRPPVATPDAYTVDGQLTVAAPEGVLANDEDPDSSLRAELVEGPDHGTLTLAADGGFTYVPEPSFHGSDRFQYDATDGTSKATATVFLAVVADEAQSDPGPEAKTSADDAAGCGCAAPAEAPNLGGSFLSRRR